MKRFDNPFILKPRIHMSVVPASHVSRVTPGPLSISICPRSPDPQPGSHYPALRSSGAIQVLLGSLGDGSVTQIISKIIAIVCFDAIPNVSSIMSLQTTRTSEAANDSTIDVCESAHLSLCRYAATCIEAARTLTVDATEYFIGDLPFTAESPRSFLGFAVHSAALEQACLHVDKEACLPANYHRLIDRGALVCSSVFLLR